MKNNVKYSELSSKEIEALEDIDDLDTIYKIASFLNEEPKVVASFVEGPNWDFFNMEDTVKIENKVREIAGEEAQYIDFTSYDVVAYLLNYIDTNK